MYVFPSLDVARFLISCGADANSVNDNRALALHLVVSNDDFDLKVFYVTHYAHNVCYMLSDKYLCFAAG